MDLLGELDPGVWGGAPPTPDELAASLALVTPYPGMAGAAEPPPEPSPESSADFCPQCQTPMVVRAEGSSVFVCPDCGRMEDCPEPQAKTSAIQPRLRVVGPDCHRFQRDLDRGSPAEQKNAQIREIFETLVGYERLHIERGRTGISHDVLLLAATYFQEIREICTKRSNAKQEILTILIFVYSLEKGYRREISEIAEFMCLKSGGAAKGENFVRSVAREIGISIDLDRDRADPTIDTIFIQLRLAVPEGEEDPETTEKYKQLKRAVRDVVDVARNNLIGEESMVRSKVAGATFEVLRRAGRKIEMKEIAEKTATRVTTITKFTDVLRDYHRFFKGVYRFHGLVSSPLPSK